MDYKKIKYLPNFSHYEMSQDGKSIRNTETKEEATIDYNKLKVELVGDDGTKKSHGVKTLYWNSWNKAPEMFGTKKVVSAVKPSKRGSSVIAGSKQLLSKFALNELKELLNKRSKMGASVRGLDIFDGKTTEMRVVLAQNDVLLVRVYCQNWRDGFWFFNPKTAAYKVYDEKADHPGKGDDGIKWPKL